MSTKLLQHIGLTEEQAKIYSCLITTGTLPARKIALETHINRSLVYKILKQLIDQGLILETENKKSISTFTALHPSKLHSILKKKEEDLKLADQSYEEALSTLGAQYNLTCGRPTVRFYEGIEGIRMMYRDILRTGTDIQIIRSQLNQNTSELQNLIHAQVKLQAEKGIHVKAIVPTDLPYDDKVIEHDKAHLVTRRRIPTEELHLPALVIVYGNKVSMTAFGDCIITTVIEDKTIADTYRVIFERLWKTAQV